MDVKPILDSSIWALKMPQSFDTGDAVHYGSFDQGTGMSELQSLPKGIDPKVQLENDTSRYLSDNALNGIRYNVDAAVGMKGRGSLPSQAARTGGYAPAAERPQGWTDHDEAALQKWEESGRPREMFFWEWSQDRRK